MEIVALQEIHLADALNLVASAYKQQREQVPVLPERYECAESFAPQLKYVISENPGVAALENNRLVGFLTGYTGLNNFKGTQRGVFVPEWGHAADGGRRAETYLHMYEHLSEQWVAGGHLSQALSIFSIDGEAIDTWFQNGFGLVVVDAIRPLSPVMGSFNDEVEIHRGTTHDVQPLLRLMREYEEYIAGPPIFLVVGNKETEDSVEEWVCSDDKAWFVASLNGEPVAYMRCEPSVDGASDIVRDPGTMAIAGAYTRRPLWRHGIAAALLNHCVDWARSSGFERMSVDFESQNIYGSRFWLKHFQPVCYSLHRRVDERIRDARG